MREALLPHPPLGQACENYKLKTINYKPYTPYAHRLGTDLAYITSGGYHYVYFIVYWRTTGQLAGT
ncbi:hypothetical protein GCM10028806_08230 [Spirosoma terrae]